MTALVHCRAPAAALREHARCTAVCCTLLTPSCPACSTFYDRLKEVREYHRKFPTLDITEVSGLLHSQAGQVLLAHNSVPASQLASLLLDPRLLAAHTHSHT